MPGRMLTPGTAEGAAGATSCAPTGHTEFTCNQKAWEDKLIQVKGAAC